MAKIFGDLSYAETRPMYVGQPIEEIRGLQEASDKNYQENTNNRDLLDIALSNATVLEQDNPYKQAAIKRLKNTLADVSESGRWETAGATVKQAAKEYATDKALQLAMDVPKQQAAYENSLKERYGKGEISKDVLDRSIRMSRQSYKGVQKNPTTGDYEGVYGGYNPANVVNVTDVANDLAKGWASDKFGKTITYAGQDKSGRWIIKGEDGKIVEGVNQDEVSKYIAQALSDNPKVQDYYRTLGDLHNHENRNREFVYDKNGIPMEYLQYNRTTKDKKGNKVASNIYSQFRSNVIKQYTDQGQTPPPEKEIANMFDNNIRTSGEIGRAAGFAGAKYGWNSVMEKHGNTDYDANPYELQNEKDAKEDGITIANQSALVPGEDFDANEVKKNVDNVDAKIKAIDSQLKLGTGNYAELANQRKFLVHQQDVAKGTLKNVIDNYLNTPEGQREFDAIANYNGKGTIKKDDLYNHTSDTWEKLESWGNLRHSKSGMIEEFRDNAAKYAQKAPISYSANVLTGGKGINAINKELTDRVLENGTNYVVEGGVQLSDFLDKNVPQGGKINVAVADGRFGNKYGHYMTISDKDGKKLKEVPIYPVEGDSEMDYVGRKLMEENNDRKDQHQSVMFDKGLKMRADAMFPSINDDLEVSLNDVTETSPVGSKAAVNFNYNIGKDEYGAVLFKSRDSEDTGNGGKGVNTNYRIYSRNPDGSLGELLVEGRNKEEAKVKFYKEINGIQ